MPASTTHDVAQTANVILAVLFHASPRAIRIAAGKPPTASRIGSTNVPRDQKISQAPGGDAIPLVALGVCLWLVAQSNADDWLRVSVLLALGLALLTIEKWYHSTR